MASVNPEHLRVRLWERLAGRAELQIYGILDGAQSPKIYSALHDSELDFACLFAGELGLELAMAAPYLVRLEPEDRFTTWLLRHGWGNNWGVFLSTSATLQELRLHFRKLALVKTETGESLYFRYYDPRVLRTFLPTCTVFELQEMFGPVSDFLVESKDAAGLVQYGWTDSGLKETTIPLPS